VNRQSNSSSSQLLEIIEYSRVFTELYPGAVYFHQGQKYLIVEVNLLSLTAYCEPAPRVGYQTIAKTVVTVSWTRQIHGTDFLSFGLLKVHAELLGFTKVWSQSKKVEWGGGEVFASQLPPVEYGTCGVVINLPVSLQVLLLRHLSHSMIVSFSHRSLFVDQNYISVTMNRSLRGSIHLVNHALLVAIQLFLDCDISSDLETEHWKEDQLGSHTYR
jgi:ATP-dependent helicase YprA (DUF1998 family)